MAILALEKDLFFAVKICDTLQHYHQEVIIVRTLPAFEQALTPPEETPQPDLAIVNIAAKGVDWEAAIRAARSKNIPVLAFGSHMDLDARARALQAGAEKIVANSKFTSDMPGIVQRMLT